MYLWVQGGIREADSKMNMFPRQLLELGHSHLFISLGQKSLWFCYLGLVSSHLETLYITDSFSSSAEEWKDLLFYFQVLFFPPTKPAAAKIELLCNTLHSGVWWLQNSCLHRGTTQVAERPPRKIKKWRDILWLQYRHWFEQLEMKLPPWKMGKKIQRL